jgi:lipopolysaccharide biosynthesis glycosyltransferase
MPENTVGETTNVLASCDEKYAQHLGIMFLSMLKNSKDCTAIHFYLVDSGMSSVNQSLIRELVESFNAKLTMIPGQQASFTQFDAGRFGVAALQRLAMAEMMPADIKRVIYLDADMIVLGDINELAKFDLGGYPLAAVENLSPKASVGIKLPRSGYFNSGLLVTDLDYWRQNGIKERAINYLNQNLGHVLYLDQCALNGVFEEQWARLPLRWNLQVDAFGVLKKYFDESCGYTKQELIEAIASPAIIHYIGANKPWLWNCYSPYKNFYTYYKNLSPWKDEPKADASFMAMAKYKLALRKRFRQWYKYTSLDINVRNLH